MTTISISVKRQIAEIRQIAPDIFPDRKTTAYYDYEVPNYYHIDYVMINLETKKAHNGGRQAPLLLSANDWKYVRAIQPEGEIQPKMNWLGDGAVEGKGRPCWMRGSESFLGGLVTSIINSVGVEQKYKCDSMIYGLSPVRVRMDTAVDVYFKFPVFPSGKTEKATFYQLDHFKRSMEDMELGPFEKYEHHYWDRGTEKVITANVRKNVIPLIQKGYIQVCSEHQAGGKVALGERGMKLFPVFDPAEGAQYQDGVYHIWGGAFGL